MIEKSIFKDGANKNLTHPKQEKGITLIALIITIVVLLILAAVTINTMQNTDIIGKAKKAVEDMDEAQMKEMVKLAWMEAYMLETDEEKTDEWYYNYVIEYLKSKGVTQEKLDKYIITVDKNGANAELKNGNSNVPGEINNYDFYYDMLYTAEVDFFGEKFNIGLAFYEANKAIGFIKLNELMSFNNLDMQATKNEYVVLPLIAEMEANYKKSIATATSEGEEISKIEFSEDGKTATIKSDKTGLLPVGTQLVLNEEEGIGHSVYWSDSYSTDGMSVELYSDGSGLMTEGDKTTNLGNNSFNWKYNGYYSEEGIYDTSQIGLMMSFDGNTLYTDTTTTNGSQLLELERNSGGAENQVSHNGTIPEGGVYYTGVKSTALGEYTGYTGKYEAGDAFPSTVSAGDVYVYGEYEYRYNFVYMHINTSNSFWLPNDTFGVASSGWGVRVFDLTKGSYEIVLSEINNKDVTNLISTYSGNTVLTTTPKIQNSVIDMSYAFNGCSNLTTVLSLPNSIINMNGSFQDCTSLQSVSTLPVNVKNMDATFQNCTNLTYVGSIPSSVESMRTTFNTCTSLVSAPDLSGATNLTNMAATFMACENLTNVGIIPSNVTDMGDSFYGCTALSGTITINANPTEYASCFRGTVKTINLVGSCSNDVKVALAATATNNNVKYY